MNKQEFLKMFSDCLKDGSIQITATTESKLVGGEYGHIEDSIDIQVNFKMEMTRERVQELIDTQSQVIWRTPYHPYNSFSSSYLADTEHVGTPVYLDGQDVFIKEFGHSVKISELEEF